jgi:hypothetical protein
VGLLLPVWNLPSRPAGFNRIRGGGARPANHPWLDVQAPGTHRCLVMNVNLYLISLVVLLGAAGAWRFYRWRWRPRLLVDSVPRHASSGAGAAPPAGYVAPDWLLRVRNEGAAVPRDAAPTEFAGAGPMGSSRAEFDGVPDDMVRRLSGTESGPGRSSRSPGDAGKRAAAGAVPIRSRRDQRRRTQGESRDCGPAAGPPGGDLSASQGNRDDENRSRIRDA